MSECWYWARAIDSNGYGAIGWWQDGKAKRFYAHRVIYEALIGPIAQGLQLDHLCRVRCCINPEHLEPVTQKVNSRRGISPKFEAWRNGICTKGHDSSNFYRRKSNGKVAYCRICKMDKLRARAKREGNWAWTH